MLKFSEFNEEKTIEVTTKSGNKFIAPIKVSHKDWHIVKHPVSGKQYRVDHSGKVLEEETIAEDADKAYTDWQDEVKKKNPEHADKIKFKSPRDQRHVISAEHGDRSFGTFNMNTGKGEHLGEETELDEAVEVSHDRYIRSHGKKASGRGLWAFTHKRQGDVDYHNDSEFHQATGSFDDAKKSAKIWAKKHGHSAAYVMEDVQVEEYQTKDKQWYQKPATHLKGIKPVTTTIHRVGVTVSDPQHAAISKRKETIQKFVQVHHHSDDKDEAIARGKKHFEKKGWKVHDAWHAGVMNEEVEQIDEISKSTIGSYAKKAAVELPAHQTNATLKHTGPIANAHAGKHPKTGESPVQWDDRKVRNRQQGIIRAVSKLAKEEVEQIEEDLYSDHRSSSHQHYMSGYKAQSEGKSRQHNPYKEESLAAKHWAKGWEHASDKKEPMKFTEETEQIDEISKETLKSYIPKALGSKSAADFTRGVKMAQGSGGEEELRKKSEKRSEGIHKAIKKLTQEELNTEEIQTKVQKHFGGPAGKDYKVKINFTTNDGERGSHTHVIKNVLTGKHAKHIAMNKHGDMFGDKHKSYGTSTEGAVEIPKAQSEEVELSEGFILTEGLAVHGKYSIKTGPLVRGMGEGRPDHVKAHIGKLKKIDVKADAKPGDYGTTHRVVVKNNETGDTTHHHVYQSDKSGTKPIMSIRTVGAPRANQDEHHQVLKDYLTGKKPTTQSVKEELEQIDEISKNTLQGYVSKAAISMYDKGLQRGSSSWKKTDGKKLVKRLVGIQTAAKKLAKEEIELEEAVKINSRVKIHAPGKDYHGEVGTIGEIRHGAYKGAPKTYTVDYGDRKSVQLDKKNIKMHKEETELAERADLEKGHIEQSLADKDINSKVEGKKIQVHKDNVAKAKSTLKKLGYHEHEVHSGLNEETDRMQDYLKALAENPNLI